MSTQEKLKTGDTVWVATWNAETGQFDNWDDCTLATIVKDKGNTVQLIYLDDISCNIEEVEKKNIKSS